MQSKIKAYAAVTSNPTVEESLTTAQKLLDELLSIHSTPKAAEIVIEMGHLTSRYLTEEIESTQQLISHNQERIEEFSSLIVRLP